MNVPVNFLHAHGETENPKPVEQNRKPLCDTSANSITSLHILCRRVTCQFLIYDYIIIMKKEAIKKGNTKYIVNIFLSCVPVWVFRLSSVFASRSGYYQSVNQQNVF